MNDLILAILAKWSKDAAARLPEGEYEVDETVTLRLQGVIKKSGMVEYTPTISFPLLTVMAVMLHRMGCQRDDVARRLEAAMRESLSIGEKADGEVGELVEDIKSAMERVRSITASLPKSTRQGPTKIEKMKVEVVQEDDRLAS